MRVQEKGDLMNHRMFTRTCSILRNIQIWGEELYSEDKVIKGFEKKGIY